MTEQSTTPDEKPKGSSGKALFMIFALIGMSAMALYLNSSNEKKREAFNQKVEEIKKSDLVFVEKNDCWIDGKSGHEGLTLNDVKFIASKSSDQKHFHYQCADGRGYQSNVYIGKHDLSNLNITEKQAIEAHFKKSDAK